MCRREAGPFRSRIANIRLELKWVEAAPLARSSSPDLALPESDARRMIAEMRAGSKDMREELARLTAARETFERQLAAERAKSAQLQAALDETRRTSNEGKRELASAKASNSRMAKELATAKTELSDRHAAHEAHLEQIHRAHNADVADLTQQLDRAKIARDEHETARNAMASELKDANARLERATLDRKKLKDGLLNYEAKLVETRATVKQLRSQLETASVHATSPQAYATSHLATSPVLSRGPERKRPRMTIDLDADEAEVLDVDALDDFIAPGPVNSLPPRKPLSRIPSIDSDFALDPSKLLATGPKTGRRLKPLK